ncbi:MAG: helix-hairpin-helix domain-containing protein [Deltaproteobacteria bacterium]|nr:helix-hairpin-helix domain-containing protein [Deltaproteobacteria bacterium]
MKIKLISSVSVVFIVGIVLAFAGTAIAAGGHEGGLGEKKIPLNIASAEQLQKIEGMTEDLAEAIVEHREGSGFFKKPDDLLKVPGMTKEIFRMMDPKVGSEGDLYCVPREGLDDDEDDEDDDEDIPLSPSKC